jgi:hypothetical protein
MVCVIDIWFERRLGRLFGGRSATYPSNNHHDTKHLLVIRISIYIYPSIETVPQDYSMRD